MPNETNCSKLAENDLMNRPEFCRYIEALQCNSDGGVYEWGTV